MKTLIEWFLTGARNVIGGAFIFALVAWVALKVLEKTHPILALVAMYVLFGALWWATTQFRKKQHAKTKGDKP